MIQRDPGEDNLRGPFLRPAESRVLRVLGDLGQHVEARICSRKDLSRRRINCLRHIGFFSPCLRLFTVFCSVNCRENHRFACGHFSFPVVK